MHIAKGHRFASSCASFTAALLALAATCGTVAASPPGSEFPAFMATPGMNPEGVAVDSTGNVYVSVREGNHGSIWRFSPWGQGGVFADIGDGDIAGLAVGADGRLYAAMAVGSDSGVYRLDRDGLCERLPGTEAIVYANGLAFDRQGTLYVTESFSLDSSGAYAEGGIWRISRGGAAEPWLRHPLLTGIGAVLGFPVGANGIGCYHGDLYVANTDLGIVVRVPILTDGSPGEPQVWATLQEVPASPLAGSPFPLMGDGLALDVFGNVYVAVISRCAVVRISAVNRSQKTVALLAFGAEPPAPFALLDTPASVAFGSATGGRRDLFVTNLGWMADFVPGPQWPGPGIVHVSTRAPAPPLR